VAGDYKLLYNEVGIWNMQINNPRKLEKFLLISQQDQSYFDDFIKTVDDVDKFRLDYPSLMFYACLTIGSMTSIKSLKTLIDMKYDVNKIRGYIISPLHACCIGIINSYGNNANYITALKILVEANADLNYIDCERNCSLIDILFSSDHTDDIIKFNNHISLNSRKFYVNLSQSG
jgi:hypothetical protein